MKAFVIGTLIVVAAVMGEVLRLGHQSAFLDDVVSRLEQELAFERRYSYLVLGGPSEQASRLLEVSSRVDYGDRWLDLASGNVVSGGNIAGDGPGTREILPGQP